MLNRRPRREPTQSTYSPKPRAPAVAVAGPARATVAVPKLRPVRDEAYRRAVAALPCAHCGVVGFSQAAHGDQGKGLAIKASDDTCYPACGPRPGIPGCHWLIGTSGQIEREARRELERRYAEQTRKVLNAA
jgi:hypothetical protein